MSCTKLPAAAVLGLFLHFREIGDIATNGKKRKITVSTVAEAEFYANGGYDDILYGKPITHEKLQRCVPYC